MILNNVVKRKKLVKPIGGNQIVRIFAGEFISHLREGNRKTRNLEVARFLLYLRVLILRLYFLSILFLAASFPSM